MSESSSATNRKKSVFFLFMEDFPVSLDRSPYRIGYMIKIDYIDRKGALPAATYGLQILLRTHRKVDIKMN
jgi:hypothetical protein